LALLLTGQAGFAEAGKRLLRSVLDDLPVRERTTSCQLHTWCDALGNLIPEPEPELRLKDLLAPERKHASPRRRN